MKTTVERSKKLASFTAPCKYIDDVLAAVKRDRYVEWDLNTLPFSLSTKRMEYVRDTINEYGEVTFHIPYGFWDIGINDPVVFDNSLGYYNRLFSAIEFLGLSDAVIHVGAATGSDEQTALSGLEKLVQEAKKHGIRLCVENLIHGLSSNMVFIKRCLEIDGLFMCLDTGHAECVRREKGDQIFQDIASVKDKIIHAHVYDHEDAEMNHIPFTEESISTNLWLPLLNSSSCEWYTMELDLQSAQDRQKQIIADCFFRV